MNHVEWSMQGVELANCNCGWGCPCQFNGPPTHGHCRAYTFIHVERGRYGDVVLDGLNWGILGMWPGAIHLGQGTFQSIIDERADARQRAALEAISQGRDTEPGKLIWQVFSTTVTTVLPTLFKPITLAIDLPQSQAQLSVPGVLEGRAEPIRNPKTGLPHPVKVTLPQGFEFTESTFASGTSRSSGPIELNFAGTHAHLARIHWSTHGVVR